MKNRPRLMDGTGVCVGKCYRIGGYGARAAGNAYYICPLCRVLPGGGKHHAWVFEVFDDSNQREIRDFKTGFRPTRSGAVRALRREIERRKP